MTVIRTRREFTKNGRILEVREVSKVRKRPVVLTGQLATDSPRRTWR